MRLELAGSLIHPDPIVVAYFENTTFDSPLYRELGYTHFEVICIGAGGGLGGGVDTQNTDTLVRNYGGSGGGGGFHRVRGLLSALPTSCSVIVGLAGSNGTSSVGYPPNVGLITDGGDGGSSSFNTTTCLASGGKGGKRVQSNSVTVTTQAHGGDGGLGNRGPGGGGALGGVAGTPTSTGPGTAGTAGKDGTWFNNVGQGGGGGAGGVGKYGGVTCNAATAGGRGSYNPADTSVYGPGGLPSNDASSGAANIVPGGASGAKAAPLNGLPTVYGQSKTNGVVIIRLTAE